MKRGTFAVRSPARPNPIAMSVVRLLRVDGNRLSVVGLDCLDGTPLLDIKPYFASTDSVPEAVVGWHKREGSRRSSFPPYRFCALSVFIAAPSGNLSTFSVIFPVRRGETDEGVMSRSVPFAALVAAAALSCGAAKAEPLFAFLTPPTQTQIAPQAEPQAVEPAPADERDDAQACPALATSDR